MADHLTEEEQIQALKDWWKTYWKSVVAPVVIVAGGYFGWNVWQDKQALKAAEGGEQYKALISALETSPGKELSDEKRAEADVLATKIAQDFGGSLYADQANLILAKLAVDKKDLSAAEGFLQRVLSEGANQAIKDLATVRLARVKLALNDLEGALSLVATSGESKYASQFSEVRGDALAAQGKADVAKTAYQEAMDALTPQEFQRRSILQIKLDGVDILAGGIQLSASPDNGGDAQEESEDSQSAEEKSESADAQPENS